MNYLSIQLCFAIPTNNRLKSTNYFIMNIKKKLEFQQIPFNYSSDIKSESLQKCTAKYLFLVIDTTLALDNPLRFSKNLLDRN